MYRQNTHGILLQNISTGLGLFWDDFHQKKKNIPSETWSHPPTSKVFLDFFYFFLFTWPLSSPVSPVAGAASEPGEPLAAAAAAGVLAAAVTAAVAHAEAAAVTPAGPAAAASAAVGGAAAAAAQLAAAHHQLRWPGLDPRHCTLKQVTRWIT